MLIYLQLKNDNQIQRIERRSSSRRGIKGPSSLGYRQDSMGLEIAETTLC
jgi:hypothetical protein